MCPGCRKGTCPRPGGKGFASGVRCDLLQGSGAALTEACCMRATMKTVADPYHDIFCCFPQHSANWSVVKTIMFHGCLGVCRYTSTYFYLVFFHYFLPKCTTEPLPPVGVKRLLFKSARAQCSLDQISSWNCLRRAGWVVGFFRNLKQ